MNSVKLYPYCQGKKIINNPIKQRDKIGKEITKIFWSHASQEELYMIQYLEEITE